MNTAWELYDIAKVEADVDPDDQPLENPVDWLISIHSYSACKEFISKLSGPLSFLSNNSFTTYVTHMVKLYEQLTTGTSWESAHVIMKKQFEQITGVHPDTGSRHAPIVHTLNNFKKMRLCALYTACINNIDKNSSIVRVQLGIIASDETWAGTFMAELTRPEIRAIEDLMPTEATITSWI